MPKKLPDKSSLSHKKYALYEDIEYKEYWNDPLQILQDRLENKIISDLMPASGRRIIDLGCGYGRLASCYLDRFNQSVLFDGSLSLLAQARDAIGERARYVAGDVNALPFKNASFDSILIIRVLHHVQELQKTFGEMRRILSKKGSFIFSYHNKRNAHRILKWFMSRKIANPFSLESKEVCPLLLSHHPTLIKKLVRNAGFSAPRYQGAVVLGWLAKITAKFNNGVPAGTRWAPFMGKFKLAPWLLARSVAEDGEELQPGDSIDDLFQCPACAGNLSRTKEDYECSFCRRRYPIRDRIFDFRL